MRILDRYVLQKFLLPFIYCFLGFIAIWFIFDLSDNLQDFMGAKSMSVQILLYYYASQFPQIIVLCLPIGTLLALLYALTAMSRTNEIISMLGAGVSVMRILVPLIGVGLVLTAITAYFNYEAAPHSEMIKKQLMKEIKRGKKKEPGLTGHLYRNREDMRTWFMRKIQTSDNTVSDLEIIQQNADYDITAQWFARNAAYDPETQTWVLRSAKYVEFNKDGDITKTEFKDEIRISGWKETAWRIASSVMNPEYLSVEELEDYLEFNKDFPQARLAPYRTHLQYRWAVPWSCVLVVLLAAPMGIVYSRRGILGGVAFAIGLFFLFYFLSFLFLALGKGNRVPPVVAVWGPVVTFACIGLVLIWYRSTNRDLPKLKLPWT